MGNAQGCVTWLQEPVQPGAPAALAQYTYWLGAETNGNQAAKEQRTEQTKKLSTIEKILLAGLVLNAIGLALNMYWRRVGTERT